MGVTVDVQNFGVMISQPEKERQVFLYDSAWKSLAASKKKITKALKAERETQLQIDEVKDIRVHITTFQDKCYVHIRRWWNDKPTKNGVALLEEEWDQLKTHLGDNEETSLGVSVMKRMVRERMQDAMRATCEGCVKDWASQTDHDCLMERQSTAELAVKKAMKDLPVCDFIHRFAQEAAKENLVLESPHQTYKRIMMFHADEIREEVVADFDD